MSEETGQMPRLSSGGNDFQSRETTGMNSNEENISTITPTAETTTVEGDDHSLPVPTPKLTVNTENSHKTHGRNPSTVSMNQTNLKSIVLFVKSTLESILKTKELKKLTSCQRDIERTIKSLDESITASGEVSSNIDSLQVFEALRSCCRSKVTEIQIKALDCLSKLFSFQALDDTLLVNPPNSMASNDQNSDNTGITPPPKVKLIDAVIDTICDCFEGENTDSKVELQVVRALASCILTCLLYTSRCV